MVVLAVLLASVCAIAGCGSPAAPSPPPVPVATQVYMRAPAPHETISVSELMGHVTWLCDPERAGRGSYQPGGQAAADYVARSFEASGLEVHRQPVLDGVDNIIGVLRGDGDAVLVSAHYDHVGVDAAGVVHPGADDNASGVAVLLSMARALSKRSGAGHTVVFIAFGAEEDGLKGSSAYIADPFWPLDETIALVNFDMVGRNLFELIGTGTPGGVGVVGLETSKVNRDTVQRAADAERMKLLFGSARMLARFGFDGRTDDWWFRERGVATIHFSTGLHRDYHKPTDTPDKLRPQQMRSISRIATRVVVELAGL